jgi:glutamate dehydrogenase (NAD(P)+)
MGAGPAAAVLEEEEVTRREYHILDRAFDQMVMRSKADNVPHRTAAMAIGVEKVRAAKNTRGLFP